VERELKVGFLISHPIQYNAPVFRELARQPGIALTVIYCCAHGLREGRDRRFGVRFRWDVPLLEGYRHRFLPDVLGDGAAPRPPLRPLNPGVVGELLRERYDVLIVHGYAYVTCWLAFAAARFSGSVVLVRGESNLLRRRSAPKRAAKWLCMRALARLAHGYLAVGTESRRYAEACGVPPHRVFLSPYCVDNGFFARGRGRQVRQRLGLEPGTVLFAFVGKLYPRKAPMDLLMAFRRASTAGGGALMFVGDGAQRGELEGYAARHGLRGVRFVGFVNQSHLPHYYAAADVLVLPSRAEPWGLVVNEAMASGCAVVVSDACGCAADLVRDGVNGYVFPAGDVDALARILRELAGDPAGVRAMGRQSLRIIRGWTPQACAERMAQAARAAWRQARGGAG